MTVYLDNNATTPIDARVRDAVVHHLTVEFGNAGSRTHDLGARAKRAVQKARDQVAAVVGAKRDEVVFTSGATESNNLVLLGIAAHGEAQGKRHILSSRVEHKAILEPLEALEGRGFEVELLPPTEGGWVSPEAVRAALRPDTLIVSLMHVNNETGAINDLEAIGAALADHPAYLHTDAAQSFGKELETLRTPRVDFISVSGHKVHAPKGVGALIARRRGFKRPPLTPLMYGGGQERGLRPGTAPVHLIVGLGLAVALAAKEAAARRAACQAFRSRALDALAPLSPKLHGDPARAVPHVLNLSFDGVDSEALIVALKGLVAISNGSACTSHSYEPSHVLRAMGLPDEQIEGAVRLSWSHMTEEPDWPAIVETIQRLR